MGVELLMLFVCLGLAGAFGVWLMTDPPSHGRGIVRIASADPLLEQARRRARASLDTFRALAQDHPGRAMIKLRVDHADGVYRGRWADLESLLDEGARAVLRGPGRAVTVPWESVEDWQVELPEGTWRGGFTVVAVWRIHQRDTGSLPDDARQQLPRFLDA